jgi:hypothetical protein
MSSVNIGEIGQVITVNYGSDISSALKVNMLLEPESGEKKEFIAVVGTVQVIIDNEVLDANEYAQYTTASIEDLDYVGRWRKKLEVEFSSTDIKQTNYEKFRVLA